MAATDLTTSTLVAQHLQRSLTTAETAYVGTLIEAVTARIETIAGRGFIARDYVEWYDGGRGQLTLNNWPVVYVQELRAGECDAFTVKYVGSAASASAAVTDSSVILFEDGQSNITVDFATYTTTNDIATQINAQTNWECTQRENAPASTLYPSNVTFERTNDQETLEVSDAFGDWRVIDLKSGIVEFNPIKSFQRVQVRYNAGYSTAPADVQQIATEWTARGLQAGRVDVTKASEGLGDYNYSNATQVLDKMSEDANLRAVLAAYSDILVR